MKTKHFKMEGIHMLKDLLRAGPWMAKIDMKDAYFMIPIAQEDRDLFKFPMEGQDVPVQLPTVRAVLGSVGLYQDHTTSRDDPAGGGTASDHLHRQYSRRGGDRVSTGRSHHSSGVPVRGSWVCYQLPQVRADPHSGNKIPGVTVNSSKMELRLPGEKIKKIRAEAGKIQSDSVSALALSRLIGKMNAATQAIPMAPLCYRNLQTCLRDALQEDQNYSPTTLLTEEAREDLEWWKDHFTEWNGWLTTPHSPSTPMSRKKEGSVQWDPHRGPVEP